MVKIAIVGRPNVGKSALFNRMIGKKQAIVDEAEGITRDRLYAETDVFGRTIELIDTGGIDSRSTADFNELIKKQAELAIEEADGLIMVVDSKVGATTLDQELAPLLLKTDKPVCLAVNKVDDYEKEALKWEFQSLGISRIVAVSATQNWNIAELLEEALAEIPPKEHIPTPKNIQIAIVGRPNVGKSSLVNTLLDENRCIVSPIAGTTRDSIDVSFTYENEEYTLIDTAGIRRKGAEHEVVDKFAAIRTQRAIDRADVCLLMLDANSGITTQEKKIANMIEEAGKGCIILLNKWDLVEGYRMEHCLRSIEEEVPFLKHCPKIFTSATTGRNIHKIFPLAQEVYAECKRKVTTHQLNTFIGDCLQRTPPPMIRGKRLRIYYMTQVSSSPQSFVLFVNYPELILKSYKRYLVNQFRQTYRFTGVPIQLNFRGKKAETKK